MRHIETLKAMPVPKLVAMVARYELERNPYREDLDDFIEAYVDGSEPEAIREQIVSWLGYRIDSRDPPVARVVHFMIARYPETADWGLNLLKKLAESVSYHDYGAIEELDNLAGYTINPHLIKNIMNGLDRSMFSEQKTGHWDRAMQSILYEIGQWDA